MKNFIVVCLFLSSFVLSRGYSYEILGSNGSNSQASKYYRGEVSTDQYIDSLIGPMNELPKSYYGELRQNQYKAFGDGYYYSDTDGNKMELKPNQYGGWDVYGN